jgi:GH15 family glucan-1,4-alpha-glucosidase
MCWAACDRLSKIANVLNLSDRARLWRESAGRIRAEILEKGYNTETNTFVTSFGSEHVDASLLQLHEVGFVASSDPKFLGTLHAVEANLKRGGYIVRYATADDFGVPTSAFLACTFWYIDALAAVGRTEEARILFERVLAQRNHAGLLSEHVHPETGELWGNFPQTYSMVGLIISAMRLSKSWEEAFWRGS